MTDADTIRVALAALRDDWTSVEARRAELIQRRRALVRAAKDAGLTRAEIAAALDVTQPFVTRLLQVTESTPTPTTEATA